MYINNYISDNISEEEIAKWEGNNILLIGNTGSGKTTFIGTKFAGYYKDKKILYFCNRITLKEQIIVEMEKNKNIDIKNYQHYEQNIDIINEIFEYDIIVCDEAHYFGTDSFFNSKNIIIYEKIKRAKCTKVFMTATPECLYFEDEFIQLEYRYEKDISNYIEGCYSYYDDKVMIGKLKLIPENEKVLYICNDTDKHIKMKSIFGDKASILVSKAKEKIYEEYNCQQVFEEIVNQSMFTSQILLATTCIDNGVSLKMPDLKHIVIDMINPITLKQILGRKRFLNSEDKVKIYIRNHNNKELAGILNKDKSIYDQANFFIENGYVEFFKKYNFTSYDTRLIYYDVYNENDMKFKLNTCYYNYYKWQKEYIADMKISNYLSYICKYIGLDIRHFISLEHEHDFEEIKNFAIKHIEEKLYVGSNLHKELVNIYKTKLLFYKPRTYGINCVSDYMNVLNKNRTDCEFKIISIRETHGKHKDKHYWWITYKDYNDYQNISA